MIAKSKSFLAKLLIFFSIILIFLGIFLQFNDNILHPVEDVTVVVGDTDEIVSITTVDEDDVIVPIEGNKNTITTTPEVVPPIDGNSSNVSGNKPSSPSQSNPSSGKDATSGGNSSNSSSSTGENSSGSTGTQEPSTTPTIEEINVQLRNNIQSTYGITVKYGNETAGYSVGGMSTTMIPDAATCQATLVNLNKELSLYPTGFFKEIKNKGYPVTFYLIKRYSIANVTGVTDSSYNNVIISIATDYDFADTFHHEVYHYIEKYILSTGFRFTSWNSLNPGGFNYGTVNGDYTYTKTFSSDAYFVNSYAQTDEYEDRASTFEYMMKSSKASCLNYGKTVWLKAKAMSEQIDYFLNTVSPNVTEYWERHILTEGG